MTEFCVEIDKQRRPDLELICVGFANCYAYHDHLRRTAFPSPTHKIIVNKAGSDYFLRHYGDATPGSRATLRS